VSDPGVSAVHDQDARFTPITPSRHADAVRDATFARDSIHRSLVKAIGVAD